MQHLFFDLDGTLTDPAPGIGACLMHAVHALGRTSLLETDLRRFIGPPLRECFAELLETDDVMLIEEAVGLYRERFASVGLFENRVYDGTPQALARLVEAGHTLTVVTSKPAVYANRIVDHFELRRFFAHVHGAELSGARSTKSELIAHALREERVVAHGARMIGDREHDVLGARHNGVPSIGVTWGYGTRAELEAAGADHVVDDFDALCTTLARS